MRVDTLLWNAAFSFLSFLFGLWAATYLQDREARRRHLGVTRALLAETRRLRTELGLTNALRLDLAFLGTKAQVPQLSPWVSDILVDIASVAPQVIAAFLDLERHLWNLRVFDRVHDQALAANAKAEQDVEEADAAFSSGTLDDLEAQLVQEAKAKLQLERRRRDAELAQFSKDDIAKRIAASLSSVETGLVELERSLSTGLYTHLPWKRFG